jgi:hypothetical protein
MPVTKPALLWLSLALLTALTACAPVTQRPAIDDKAVAEEARKQRELAFQDLMEDQARLFRISYPILARGAPLCEDKVRPSIGVRFGNLDDVGKDFRDAAAKLLGLTNELQIVLLAAGSPAERAGLREKDVIVALDGKPAPKGAGARQKLLEAIAEGAKTRKELSIKVRRDGAEQVLSVAPEPACDYPVLLHPADAINAFADGKQVVVMRGMLRFIRDDLELAVVVGHELAHNTMKHIEKQTGNVLLGTLLDILAASRGVDTQGVFGNLGGLVYSKEFEAEADYVGLYFTARAGYEVDKAPNFWRRMASASPGAIRQRGFGASHPSTPERFLALEKIVAEIRAKKAAGRELRPELKPQL